MPFKSLEGKMKHPYYSCLVTTFNIKLCFCFCRGKSPQWIYSGDRIYFTIVQNIWVSYWSWSSPLLDGKLTVVYLIKRCSFWIKWDHIFHKFQTSVDVLLYSRRKKKLMDKGIKFVIDINLWKHSKSSSIWGNKGTSTKHWHVSIAKGHPSLIARSNGY